MLDYRKRFEITPSESEISECTLQFFCSGNFLASGGGIFVNIWNTNTGKAIGIFKGRGRVLCLESIPDGSFVLCGFSSGMLVELRVDECRNIIQSTGFRPFDKSVNVVSLNPSQLVMAIAGNNGTDNDSVQIWERENVQDIWILNKTLQSPPHVEGLGRAVRIKAMFWSPKTDSNVILVAYEHHGSMNWDIKRNCPISAPSVGRPILQLSPDGEQFIVSNIQNGLDIVDITTQLPKITIPLSKDVTMVASSICFIHDGTMIICGEVGKSLIWRVHKGIVQRVRTLQQEDHHPILAIAANYDILNDVCRIATISNQKLILWQAIDIYGQEGQDVENTITHWWEHAWIKFVFVLFILVIFHTVAFYM